MDRKTKIIATLGPACDSPEAITELVAAGMDVARLNFSHGDHPTHERWAGWVRQAAAAAGRPVALLQDVQGPKIRVGTFAGGAVELAAGAEVRLLAGGGQGDAGTLYVDYPHLLEDLGPGRAVVLADGLLRLEVTGRRDQALLAEVQVGGTLRDHQGAAFPGTALRVPAVTDKDRKDLAFGRRLEVDLVAASFVRSAADVREVARLAGSGMPVIAKIELGEAYEHLDEILTVADGAMVARGDLGVELPLERLPLVQSEILERSNRRGRLSITATEMLESMIQAPRPTRAEVSDVAGSVLQGTDAVMLSGETAAGRYPARAVRTMAAICREIESSGRGPGPVGFLAEEEPFPAATAKAAVEAADSLGMRTIVAFTESGATARLLSKYRPRARVLAFTPVPATYQRMALYRGVQAMRFERCRSTDEMIARADAVMVEQGLCEPGEGVVMVAGIPPGRRAVTNFIKLHRIGAEPGLGG